ncbi:MAG: energy transducer TonB [Chitinophagaceae bacterium]|nr:energy transducer TonB [Chitinophagaceae bacterium]
MKIIIAITALILSLNAIGQTDSVRRYFDTLWIPRPKASAAYYTDFVKQGNVYRVASYYAGSDRPLSKGIYADTLFQKGIGTLHRYAETGELKDSILFDSQGFPFHQYAFHKNGKLSTHSFVNRVSGVTKIEEYDEKGKVNPLLTIVVTPAAFKDGLAGWTEYLEKNLKTNVPIKNKAPVGRYTVVVAFEVAEDGKVSNVRAETDPGYGTAEEAVRVVEKSPRWIAATQNNKPVLFRHRQSITFQVTDK